RPRVHRDLRGSAPEGAHRTLAIRRDRPRVRGPGGHELLRSRGEPVHVPRLGGRLDRGPSCDLLRAVRRPWQRLSSAVSSLHVRRVDSSDWDGPPDSAPPRDGTERRGRPSDDGSRGLGSCPVSRHLPDVRRVRSVVPRLGAVSRCVGRRRLFRLSGLKWLAPSTICSSASRVWSVCMPRSSAMADTAFVCRRRFTRRWTKLIASRSSAWVIEELRVRYARRKYGCFFLNSSSSWPTSW